MPALEPLGGLRVVADPAALDAARWQGAEVTVLRFAPDDAFGLGASAVEVDDEHAIVEPEVGFVGAWLPVADVLPHLEWALPADRPVLAQGSIANVPAKLWLGDGRGRDGDGDGDGRGRDGGQDREQGNALVITAAAYAQELAERLGLR